MKNKFYYNNKKIYQFFYSKYDLPKNDSEWIKFFYMILQYQPIDIVVFNKDINNYIQSIKDINSNYLHNGTIEYSIWQVFIIMNKFNIQRIKSILHTINYIPYNINFSYEQYKYLLAKVNLVDNRNEYQQLFLNKFDRLKIQNSNIDILLYTNLIDNCISNNDINNLKLLQKKISHIYHIDLIYSYLQLLQKTCKQYKQYNQFLIDCIPQINSNMRKKIYMYCRFNKKQKAYILLNQL